MNARQIIEPQTSQELPFWALLLLAGGGFVLMLGVALGSAPAFVGALVVVLTDGIVAVLVLLAAGGYGHLVYRRWAPSGAGGVLGLATSCGLGLMLLSTAVLLAGSLLRGALSAYVWWPVVGAGVALALWQAHRPLASVRLPRTVSGWSLVWVVASVSAGLGVAGACLPPGCLGNLTHDSYDILEYHLQLPREFYLAGGVRVLDHNVYSHYPLGAEMLFLLAMCLRGGPYEGMYLAQFVSGLFAAAMIAGAYGFFGGRVGSADGSDRVVVTPTPAGRFRAMAAVALVATAPWVIYLGWLAMAELAQMCYLVLALVWLGRWLRQPVSRSAGWIGALLGCACAVKYLSVGFVVAPVLAVMLIASIRRRREKGSGAFRASVVPEAKNKQARQPAPRAWLKAPGRFCQVVLAGALAAAVFSPWLVRNVVATGNPVFPLATDIFGDDGWDAEPAQRWRDGHAPGFHPPVPAPPDYQPPPVGPSRARLFADFWLGRGPYAAEPSLVLLTVVLLAGTVLAMFIRPRVADAWDWSLLAVLLMQLGVWVLATRGMPGRFIACAVGPIALLVSGGLARLASVRHMPLLKQAPGAGGRWGLAPAGVLLVAAAALNLGSATKYFNVSAGPEGPLLAGAPGELLAYPKDLPGRLLLVGEAPAFFRPAGTVYATVFNRQPLEALLREHPSPAAAVTAMRALGITHVLVNWAEIRRLARSYGWPAQLGRERLEALAAGWQGVTERLVDLSEYEGLRKVYGWQGPLDQQRVSFLKEGQGRLAPVRVLEPYAAPSASAPASAPVLGDSDRKIFTLYVLPGVP